MRWAGRRRRRWRARSPSGRSPTFSPAPTGRAGATSRRSSRRWSLRSMSRPARERFVLLVDDLPLLDETSAVLVQRLLDAGDTFLLATAREVRRSRARRTPAGRWRSSAATASAGSISSTSAGPSSTRWWWRHSAVRSSRRRCRRCGPSRWATPCSRGRSCWPRRPRAGCASGTACGTCRDGCRWSGSSATSSTRGSAGSVPTNGRRRSCWRWPPRWTWPSWWTGSEPVRSRSWSGAGVLRVVADGSTEPGRAGPPHVRRAHARRRWRR